jgi:hypothetical protein
MTETTPKLTASALGRPLLVGVPDELRANPFDAMLEPRVLPATSQSQNAGQKSNP